MLVGQARYLARHGIAFRETESTRDDATTVVDVAWDGRLRARIRLSDTMRSWAPAAVDQMRALGIRPVLLTGDDAQVARAVAAQLGIEQVRSRMLPEEKLEAIREP